MTGPALRDGAQRAPADAGALFLLHAAALRAHRPPGTTGSPKRHRPTRPTTEPHTDSANTTTHTEQLTDATQPQGPNRNAPTPRKRRLPSTTFNA